MMKTFINIKRFQFYLWIGAIWLMLWIFYSLIKYPETFVLQSLNEIWQVFYIVIANFIFFEYSLPLIRKKRSIIFFNILIGILLISIQLILVSFGLYGWTYLGIRLHIYTSLSQVTISPGGAFDYIMYEVFYHAQAGITSIFFFWIAKLLYDNFKLRRTTQQLRLEKKEAELNYLKSQTNPHFLFNTLNNIYTLASDKSDLAPESILRLSKILRFMLYETDGEFISVEQELEIINDYIALEKLRYDDSLLINFKYEIEDMEQPLPPLLLIPLVENAFKHGISETMNQPFVDIHLSTDQQQLIFVVKNSAEDFQGEKSVKENIGLSNLRRQLQLLYTTYDLSVMQSKSEFTATLKINLTSHV
jgi:two-component system LytT family sensor kinase